MVDSPFPHSPLATIFTILAFVSPFFIIFYILWLSRKPTGKKPLSPEPSGSWPFVGHLPLLLGSRPHHLILGELADKYGPIFTIKIGVHRTLVISNSDMAKECLLTNDKAFASRPRSLAMEILGYNYSIPGFSPYGPYWRQMRKIITLELLSNHRLEKMKHVREAEVKEAIEELYNQWVKNKDVSNNKVLLVDLKSFFWNMTLNNILKVIVGKRYVEYGESGEVEENGSSVSWRDALIEFMKLSGKVSVSDAIPYLRILDLGGVERAMKSNMEEVDHVVQGWLDEHKRRKGKSASSTEKVGHGEDFMDVMLSILEDHARDFSNRSADTINKATCLALVLGGSDTTAVTLTWTLSLLLNNPDALKKAQDELDVNVGRERQVQESDLKNLDYLQAIVKETFRLYPAVPLSLPHESMEDCTIGGYHVPAGTRLFVNVSKIQRDPCVWEDPDEFQPQRFLTTHKDCDVRGQNFELLPFGSGRRVCPGISFALQILCLTLATLLHGFEIKNPHEKPVDMTEGFGLSNHKASPLEALLKPRLPAHLYRGN